jgi:signal transduction protein with GAF and PtsI domain
MGTANGQAKMDFRDVTKHRSPKQADPVANRQIFVCRRKDAIGGSFQLNRCRVRLYLIGAVFSARITDMTEESGSLEVKLRRLVETVDVANALTRPLTRSIENLLTVTATDLGSEEASVLIRDGSDGDLRFLSAIGAVAEHLLNMKVPAGKGIAGFVFSSGQPMAVTDVGDEETFYAEVDRQTGYSTQTILATPLRHNGEIIGVLEYINRIGDPPYAAFSPDEMDKAALFADVVATLVNAYESAKLMRDLGKAMLSNDGEMDYQEVRDWLATVRETPEHAGMIELAALVRDIASRGDAEREMCREVLEAVLKYSERGTETSYLSY